MTYTCICKHSHIPPPIHLVFKCYYYYLHCNYAISLCQKHFQKLAQRSFQSRGIFSINLTKVNINYYAIFHQPDPIFTRTGLSDCGFVPDCSAAVDRPVIPSPLYNVHVHTVYKHKFTVHCRQCEKHMYIVHCMYCMHQPGEFYSKER